MSRCDLVLRGARPDHCRRESPAASACATAGSSRSEAYDSTLEARAQVQLGDGRGPDTRPGRHPRPRQRARPDRVGGLRLRHPRGRGRRRDHDHRHAAEQHPADRRRRGTGDQAEGRAAARRSSTSDSGAARYPGNRAELRPCTTPVFSASSASCCTPAWPSSRHLGAGRAGGATWPSSPRSDGAHDRARRGRHASSTAHPSRAGATATPRSWPPGRAGPRTWPSPRSSKRPGGPAPASTSCTCPLRRPAHDRAAPAATASASRWRPARTT